MCLRDSWNILKTSGKDLVTFGYVRQRMSCTCKSCATLHCSKNVAVAEQVILCC
jgi:hypothetical protein